MSTFLAGILGGMGAYLMAVFLWTWAHRANADKIGVPVLTRIDFTCSKCGHHRAYTRQTMGADT